MLTIWFLVGAAVSTLITLGLYSAARWMDSVMMYFGMIIIPMLINAIAWAILNFIANVPGWYLAGAFLAICVAFATGILARIISPGWAYLFVFIMPMAVSVAVWLIFNIFTKIWGVYHA
jgi:hypothetical protein